MNRTGRRIRTGSSTLSRWTRTTAKPVSPWDCGTKGRPETSHPPASDTPRGLGSCPRRTRSISPTRTGSTSSHCGTPDRNGTSARPGRSRVPPRAQLPSGQAPLAGGGTHHQRPRTLSVQALSVFHRLPCGVRIVIVWPNALRNHFPAITAVADRSSGGVVHRHRLNVTSRTRRSSSNKMRERKKGLEVVLVRR